MGKVCDIASTGFLPFPVSLATDAVDGRRDNCYQEPQDEGGACRV